MKRIHKAKLQWPEPHYFVGSPEFIHAIGVLSASYNLLEFRLRQFLELYTHLPHPTGTQVFISSNNQERLNLLRMCVAKSVHPLRVRNRVMRFADGYDACTQNRNILMHSETVPIIKSNGRQEVAFKSCRKSHHFLPTYSHLPSGNCARLQTLLINLSGLAMSCLYMFCRISRRRSF